MFPPIRRAMGREYSIAGSAIFVVLAVGQFAYGMRHGGSERDVSSTRIHVNAFPYSYGSKYVWLEAGERLKVHYKVDVSAGSSEIYLNDSSPWHMGDNLLAHLSLPKSGEGDWFPTVHAGWNHLLIGSRNGAASDRQLEYTVSWRVE